MPLDGEYEPNPVRFVRDQVELYESSGGTQGTTLQKDGPQCRDMLAREVTGDEKAVWWARAVEAFPDYAEYQKKTDREIPLLQPAAGPH
ncbi:nitroreductase/quinone reductase family protein [Actinoplanes sp. CA-252034]|uniref:nitroreductase/quinone reductase family protein n=1 Tax=Actinoplanes sp. CA-252034 TaxID=3239906 RepID=UPI003D960F42